MTKSSSPSLYTPRHWLTWAGLGLLWLLCRLPFPVLLGLGRLLGRAMYHLIPRRRHIARVNIGLCFPERSAAQQQDLLYRHFEAMGIMVFELGLSWWGSSQRLRALTRIEGLEHLETALAAGQGVLLLGAHYTTLEISGHLISLCTSHPIQSMYRPHENLVINHIMARGRVRCLEKLIPRDDIRGLLKALKANRIVWYAPDQAYEGKGFALVPFFGVDAPTNTGTPRIARLSGTQVLPFVSHRLPGSHGYQLKILPALDNFPGDDEVADTARIQRLFEAQIREYPEQYFWLHRRFKRKRGADADVYRQDC